MRVWGGEIEGLKAFGIVLNYDPKIVRFQNANPGPANLLESQGGSAPLFGILKTTTGEIALGNGITEGESVSGQGLLAELNFHLLGSANDVYFRLREAYIYSSGDDVRRVKQVRSSQLRPTNFHLSHNYPNPFNSFTSIDYALPKSGLVQLNVFDILGR